MKTKIDLTNKYIIWLIAAFCCLLWGSAFPAIRYGYTVLDISNTDTFSIILFAGIRFFGAGVLTLIIFSLISKKPLLPAKQDLPHIGVLSVFQTILQYLFFYLGLAFTTGSRASIVNSTSVFFALLIAALLFAWEKYAGDTDGLTVMQMIYRFGGEDMKTGMIYLILIFLGLVLLFALGAGFHSGDRHAFVLEEKGLLKGKRLKVLLCRICSVVFLLPLIIAFIVVAIRYAPLLDNVSGVVSGDVAKPNTRVTLIILGIGGVLTLPLLPLRSMVTAAYVRGLRG